MALDQVDVECVECERLENEFIRVRNKMRKLKFPGQQTTAIARISAKLDEDERAALSTYKDHRIGHYL